MTGAGFGSYARSTQASGSPGNQPMTAPSAPVPVAASKATGPAGRKVLAGCVSSADGGPLGQVSASERSGPL